LTKETLTAEEMLKRLSFFETQAEEAYARMYDAKSGSELAARYSDVRNPCTRRLVLRIALGFAMRASG
jgi:hypothetical protein